MHVDDDHADYNDDGETMEVDDDEVYFSSVEDQQNLPPLTSSSNCCLCTRE